MIPPPPSDVNLASDKGTAVSLNFIMKVKPPTAEGHHFL